MAITQGGVGLWGERYYGIQGATRTEQDPQGRVGRLHRNTAGSPQVEVGGRAVISANSSQRGCQAALVMKRGTGERPG